MKFQNKVNILNRKARFNYELLDKYEAGLVLYGTEIKSIREGKASISESFCQFINEELYVINMTVEEYFFGTRYNHPIKRERKLLLQKKEINKILRKTKETGLTIVPTRLYINEKGWAKIQIYIARGKKLFDKRESIKQRETKRNIDRLVKKY
ncbi:SsrA-binding protein SmpB [Apibacter adventoris]|uniref:SsrA-binding protein n=1 Tax=Apibacter adventoris TaxID=1679466 RepID=A0A2S8AE74_9FLAO|nr:SsrA-binding protein SmpB [Apibacter adventoris]PQL93168.1 SsrA-binding protein [Apibacter adventoris]PQL95899.1 SsrA-binding protein [Apibacter adventoris]